MFDQDVPGVRQTADGYRLYRNVENPNEVFVQVEFSSAQEARNGADKLVASGVLDRWPATTTARPWSRRRSRSRT